MHHQYRDNLAVAAAAAPTISPNVSGPIVVAVFALVVVGLLGPEVARGIRAVRAMFDEEWLADVDAAVDHVDRYRCRCGVTVEVPRGRDAWRYGAHVCDEVRP